MKKIGYIFLLAIFIVYAIPEIKIQLCHEVLGALVDEKDFIVEKLLEGDTSTTTQNLYEKEREIIKEVKKQMFWEEIQERTFFWK
jgi:hypothetical protein